VIEYVLVLLHHMPVRVDYESRHFESPTV